MRKGKSKVAWEVVCLPKDEGGLGLRRLDHFNKALMVSHIWKLLSLKESLWVKWVHAYKLRGRSFWDIPLRGNMSWGWRKVLQIRPLIREFVWHNIGDGALTSLCSIVMPNHVDRPDLLEWRDEDGNVKSFSVSMVWRSIRPRSNKVTWVDVVWFSSCDSGGGRQLENHVGEEDTLMVT
nr:reverse transcriptase zinc-binding domain-containing protein [Tanacetum cinerariifolium]